MNKLIAYDEPYFNPYTHEYDHANMTTCTIIVNTQEDFDETMAAITNPAREIPQDSIVVTDAPPNIDPIDQLRADLDYIALMNGVDLSV